MPADIQPSEAPTARDPIRKDAAHLPVAPNLRDYEATCASFRWEEARLLLDGLPGNEGLNMAYEAVDRHLHKGRADKVALRWIGKAGARRELSFRQLSEETNRFANALASLGVQPGDRVFVMMGRLPELYVAVLGALKARCAVTPLFSQFGPEPIATRAEMADARVLVTTPELYQRKVQGLRERLPGLRHVILAGADAGPVPGTQRWDEIVAPASSQYTIGPTDPESMALLHFTSGTTGRPKGAVHVHAAVLAHVVTGVYALDLHEDDVFWCTADPGWVTGTSYGILAPLCNGVTSVVVEEEFDAETWYSVLERERVTVWYTAPTAIRMMMKLGAQAVRGHNLSALRFAASVGEPLNPEGVLWGQEAFGLPFHDNWWQTETGGIMVANFAAVDIKPGSMGKPLPGITAAIVRKRADGGIEVVDAPMVDGELALRTPWPSMMRGAGGLVREPCLRHYGELGQERGNQFGRHEFEPAALPQQSGAGLPQLAPTRPLEREVRELHARLLTQRREHESQLTVVRTLFLMHLEEDAPAVVPVAQGAEAPAQFARTFRRANGVAHGHPAAAVAAVHQEAVSHSVERQRLVAAQHELRVGQGRAIGDGAGAFQLRKSAARALVGPGAASSEAPRWRARWPLQRWTAARAPVLRQGRRPTRPAPSLAGERTRTRATSRWRAPRRRPQ